MELLARVCVWVPCLPSCGRETHALSRVPAVSLTDAVSGDAGRAEHAKRAAFRSRREWLLGRRSGMRLAPAAFDIVCVCLVILCRAFLFNLVSAEALVFFLGHIVC